MSFIRRIGIGIVVGAIVGVIWALLFDRYPEEIAILALIGGLISAAFGKIGPDKVITLGTLQELIEQGEYDRHEVSEWKTKFFCGYDGAISKNEKDECPNPNHPYPIPRTPNHWFLRSVIIGLCLVFAYSIYTNEALVTLIVTFLLLIVSAIVFVILFVLLMSLIFKAGPSPTRGSLYKRLLELFSALVSGFFAMVFVSLWLGQFPSPIWWVIEFAIGCILDGFAGEYLATWVISRFRDRRKRLVNYLKW